MTDVIDRMRQREEYKPVRKGVKGYQSYQPRPVERVVTKPLSEYSLASLIGHLANREPMELKEAVEKLTKHYEMRCVGPEGFSLKAIAQIVAEKTNVCLKNMRHGSRSARNVQARQMFCYMALNEGFSSGEVGTFLKKDHTSVFYAAARYAEDNNLSPVSNFALKRKRDGNFKRQMSSSST